MPATVQTGTEEGLLTLLSTEREPKYPELREKEWQRELEIFHKNLLLYIKKLNGKFTAHNIISTIIGGGQDGLGFATVVRKAFHYKGTDNVSLVIDTGYDWRKSLSFLASFQGSEVSAGAVVTAPDVNYNRVANNSGAAAFIYPYTTDASWNTASGIGAPALVIQANGNLTLPANTTGVHKEYWLAIAVMAMTDSPTASPDFTLKGNGL
jgi:hypothetical protein